MPHRRLIAPLLMALAALLPRASMGQSVESFYSGKSLPMIIGFDVGGSLDVYGRLAARHLPKHLPGHPAIVPQNMPGASGLTAANYLFRAAPKDGTVLGVIHPNSAFAEVIGMHGIEYDARRFNWVGRLTASTSVFYTWHTSQTKTLADLMHRETVFGGIGPLTDGAIFSHMANEVLGTKFKMIAGYKGTAAGNHAMEAGEVEGMFNIWEGMKSINAQWLRDGKLNLIVQFVLQRHPELPQVPAIVEAAKTEQQRQVLRLFLSTAEVGRAIMMPPDVPAERVKAIRDGFAAMLEDPEFKADAAKQKLELQPLDGTDLQALVGTVFETPPEAVAVAEKVMKQ